MELEDRFEARHWWFEGRRDLFRRELAADSDATGSALDVGCGTGGNLRMLRSQSFTRVAGVDISPDAVRYCRRKGFGDVVLGSAQELPFPDESFDVILLTDVLEHVEDDVAALREAGRVLGSRGLLIVTVPAFTLLWGRQDDVSHHIRRYRRREIVRRVRAAGLTVEDSYHFNWILALPILIARRLIRWSGISVESENTLTPGPLNMILRFVFKADVRLAPSLRPPIGVSILVRARNAVID